jgi:hypothetical protein
MLMLTYFWYLPIPELLLSEIKVRERFVTLLDCDDTNENAFIRNFGEIKKEESKYFQFLRSIMNTSIDRRLPDIEKLIELYTSSKRVTSSNSKGKLTTSIKVHLYPIGLISISLSILLDIENINELKRPFDMWKETQINGIPVQKFIHKLKINILGSFFTNKEVMSIKKILNPPKLMIEVIQTKSTENELKEWVKNVFHNNKEKKVKNYGKYPNDLIVLSKKGIIIRSQFHNNSQKKRSRQQFRFNIHVLFDFSYGFQEYLFESAVTLENLAKEKTLSQANRIVDFFNIIIFLCNPNIISKGKSTRMLPSSSLRMWNRAIFKEINYDMSYEEIVSRVFNCLTFCEPATWAKIYLEIGTRGDIDNVKKKFKNYISSPLDKLAIETLLSGLNDKEKQILELLIETFVTKFNQWIFPEGISIDEFTPGLTRSKIGRELRYTGKYIQTQLLMQLERLKARQIIICKKYKGPGRSKQSEIYYLNEYHPYVNELLRKTILSYEKLRNNYARRGIHLPEA